MTEYDSSVWSRALEFIKKDLNNDQIFNLWFYPIRFVSAAADTLTLEVPNKFFKGWLLDRYMNLLTSSVSMASGRELKIEFALKEAGDEEALQPFDTSTLRHFDPSTLRPFDKLRVDPELLSKDRQAQGRPVVRQAHHPEQSRGKQGRGMQKTPVEEHKKETKSFWPFGRERPDVAREIGLNPKYTFESFVVGPSNRFAHAASLAVSDSPAKAYNPFFIYGGVGLGKTHLMHSIGQRVAQKFPKSKILYISSEEFTNQLISAIQNRTTVKFREKYRNVDVLLIDDIPFIAGKESTQEEFFHTFNALYDAHKQIVVSSDRPPKEIQAMEERLVSRFEWGLITDIQPPDFETRMAILKKKSERETITLPDDVFSFLAEKIKTNIRELEGALIRMVAYAKLIGREPSLDVAKEVLRDMILEGEKKVTIDLIQRKVSEYFDIKLSDMKAKRRSRAVAYPRQIAMYLSRELTDYSLPEIGDYFGGRDHTTVIHAHAKIENDLKSKGGLKDLLDGLVKSIRG